MGRAERERQLDQEREEAIAPHVKEIARLRRLIAVEEEHIAKKSRAVLLKRGNIRFPEIR